MSEQDSQVCGNCRFYSSVCRRYAPRPGALCDANGDLQLVDWPMVEVDDWCGEWQGRAQA
jgi:hypothetical protein